MDRRSTLGSVAAASSSKQLALVSAILASTIAAVDSSAVNVALPAIGRDLGGGLAAQQWVSNAYLLTLGAFILLAGSLTDRLGERRVFVTGVAGFGVGSLLCAAAPTSGVLIAARALQGLAGAVLTPAALAIIVAVFPRDERGAAIGRWTAWGGIGILIGPLIGGQIVDVASWRWIFALNLPLVAAALYLAARAVPGRAATARAARLDVGGAALAALALAGISFGLIEQPMRGWGSPAILGSLGAGVVLAVAFVRHEQRTPDPMLPLELFRSRNFSVANLQTFGIYGGLGIMSFFLTIFLQQVAGYPALKAGLVGLVPTVVMFTFSARVGALADRHGPRAFLTAGPVLVACGLLLMTRFGTSVSLLGQLLPTMLVFSGGLALTVAPLTATVLADADEADAGIASAVNNAIARTAALIAIAAIGAAVTAHYAAALDSGVAGKVPATAAPAIEKAKRRTFGRVDPARVPPASRAAVRAASNTASTSSFHLAVELGALLVACAGLAGLALRNPRCGAVVAAEECPGGQIVGQPSALVADHLTTSTASEPVASASR
ncbi:MAG: MFS transporter [Solirubrobacteraceae bacterium]